jgi:hypothetical protein
VNKRSSENTAEGGKDRKERTRTRTREEERKKRRRDEKLSWKKTEDAARKITEHTETTRSLYLNHGSREGTSDKAP